MAAVSTLDLRFNNCTEGTICHIVELVEGGKLDVSQLGQVYLKGHCGEIHRLLWLCPKVTELKLENTQIKGDLLKQTTLKTLKLKNCRISDSVL